MRCDNGELTYGAPVSMHHWFARNPAAIAKIS